MVKECNQQTLVQRNFSFAQRAKAHTVHLFTAMGGVLGLCALYSIHEGAVLNGFWFLATAIVVDAIDGTFARKANVKEVTPNFDGTTLDGLIDYVNYAVVPAFMILVLNLLPTGLNLVGGGLILLASAYQFSQRDAKTEDNYFKRFPSYWNIVVFYLYFWQLGSWSNFFLVATLFLLSFVPLKYIYPSRLDYFSSNTFVQRSFLAATILWGGATLGILYIHPQTNPLLINLSFSYVILYFVLSVYRTIFPLEVVEGV